MGTGKGHNKRIKTSTPKHKNNLQKDNPGLERVHMTNYSLWSENLIFSEYYLGVRKEEYTDDELSYMCTEYAHDLIDNNSCNGASEKSKNILGKIDKSKLSIKIISKRTMSWDRMDYIVARIYYNEEMLNEIEYEDKFLVDDEDGIFRHNLHINDPSNVYPHASGLVKDLLNNAFKNDDTNYIMSWN